MTTTFIVVCCVCKKELKRSKIKKMPDVIDPMISHGYCPKCFDKLIDEFQEDIKEAMHDHKIKT